MTETRCSIRSSGAVLLAEGVACDGFYADAAVRLQTHVHDDHMSGFETSEGSQRIFCLPGTWSLLVAERNGTLDIRSNFTGVEAGTTFRGPNGTTIVLRDSGHMLGSAQVEVEHHDGYRTGYSGDFSWPIDDVVQVDEIVLDSTYGSPDSIRTYSQEQAEEAFVELVHKNVKVGPVYVRAFRGTLQRALAALTESGCGFPILLSQPQLQEAAVYRREGFSIGELVAVDSPEGTAARGEGRYVLVEGRGDRQPMNRPPGYSIKLSAFYANPRDPVTHFSDRDCEVAMSNHADFAGTLEYVAATGAKVVRTDNVRGPHGVALAFELARRLGVAAVPASPEATSHRAWGA
jgi:putative mRNA 3-end processing factor